MQWFASGFERFVRAQPPLWYLWADKRWTRVFRDDPRYSRPLAGEPGVPVARPPLDAASATLSAPPRV